MFSGDYGLTLSDHCPPSYENIPPHENISDQCHVEAPLVEAALHHPPLLSRHHQYPGALLG